MKLKCAAVTGLLFFLSASAFHPANAQNFNVREDVRNDWNKASGLDNVYDFDTPDLTPAPQGYEPFYVSHYGRHGSRYAYTSSAYTVLLKLLRKEADNLTPPMDRNFFPVWRHSIRKSSTIPETSPAKAGSSIRKLPAVWCRPFRRLSPPMRGWMQSHPLRQGLLSVWDPSAAVSAAKFLQ